MTRDKNEKILSEKSKWKKPKYQWPETEMKKTCPPCLLLVMVGVAGELAVELELLLEMIT